MRMKTIQDDLKPHKLTLTEAVHIAWNQQLGHSGGRCLGTPGDASHKVMMMMRMMMMMMRGSDIMQ